MNKYVQYSSHDTNVAAAWEFLQLKNWYYIEFAAHMEIKLSVDFACLQAKKDQDCFAMNLETNGRNINLGVLGQKNIPYRKFRTFMEKISYGGKGYSKEQVIENCK